MDPSVGLLKRFQPSKYQRLQHLSNPCPKSKSFSQDMQRAHPISLNKISYDAVIRALETIRDVKPEPPIVEHVYVDTGFNMNFIYLYFLIIE
jgi:hypothetical protein